MRFRFLVVISALLVVPFVAAPFASATDTGPQVTMWSVVTTAGPGSLGVVVGTGFAPDETTQVTMVDTNDPTHRYAMAPITASHFGAVVSGTGYRTSADATPGIYAVELRQSSGAVATSTSTVTIVAPDIRPVSDLEPGGDVLIELTGLGGAPGIDRSLTVDGVTAALGPVQETFTLLRTGAEGITRVSATLPTNLLPGQHTFVYTQSSSPATSVTRSVTVGAPSLLVGTPGGVSAPAYGYGGRETVVLSGYRFGTAGAALSVRGADGRTTALADIPAHAASLTSSSVQLTLPGLPAGAAVFTATSKDTGVSDTADMTVLPSTVRSQTQLGTAGELASPSGDAVLFMDYDSTLDLYLAGAVVWSSGTLPRTGMQPRLAIQSDGNLVVYDGGGHALWASGTRSTDGPFTLSVLDEGRAVLATAHGGVLWTTPTTKVTTLPAGGAMTAGQRLYNSRYSFVVQPDGNLVLYRGSSALWASRSSGHPGAVLKLQGDGNLVLYSPQGKALWANHAKSAGVSRLLLQSDGNLVEYSSTGKALWATNTAGR